MKKRYLFIVLIILCIASIFIGVTNININDILTFNIDKIEILLISRLPRLIAIIVAGVGLSISGLIMQQISKNKFVSPTTAATADFAKLGILFCIMIIPGATIMQKMIVSFVFAGLGTVLFMKMIKAIKIKNIVFVPLIGMMLGKIVGSITTFFAYKYDLVQNISSWMEGDMSLIMKGSYELLYLSVPMVIIAFLYANKFTIVGMGEDFAINLGLNYNFVINVGLAIVSLICAVTIITVGNIQSFIQYNKQFTQPINQIAQLSSMLQSMVAAAERVFEFLEEPEEVNTAKENIDTSKLKGNVEFKHVKFGYNQDKTIIKDFSAKVKEGQKIAIVGPTGAGKTTMVKLLMRFYDVTDGEILVDEHNIKDFDRGELRKMFGMVLQDTWLFGGTVKDNIKYSKEDATDDEVIQAAKAAPCSL